MSVYEPLTAHSHPVERPRCEHCGNTMWLARIQPADEPDHDVRTFECSTCRTSLVLTVKFK